MFYLNYTVRYDEHEKNSNNLTVMLNFYDEDNWLVFTVHEDQFDANGTGMVREIKDQIKEKGFADIRISIGDQNDKHNS